MNLLGAFVTVHLKGSVEVKGAVREWRWDERITIATIDGYLVFINDPPNNVIFWKCKPTKDLKPEPVAEADIEDEPVKEKDPKNDIPTSQFLDAQSLVELHKLKVDADKEKFKKIMLRPTASTPITEYCDQFSILRTLKNDNNK